MASSPAPRRAHAGLELRPRSFAFAFVFVFVLLSWRGLSGSRAADALVQRVVLSAGESEGLSAQLATAYGFVSDGIRLDRITVDEGAGSKLLARVTETREADFVLTNSMLSDTFQGDWLQVPLGLYPMMLTYWMPGWVACPAANPIPTFTKQRLTYLCEGSLTSWKNFSASFPDIEILYWTVDYDNPEAEYGSLAGVWGRALAAYSATFAANYDECQHSLACTLERIYPNRTRVLPPGTSYASLSAQVQAAGNGLSFLPAPYRSPMCPFQLSFGNGIINGKIADTTLQSTLPSLTLQDSLARDYMNFSAKGYPFTTAVFAAVPRNLIARGCSGLQAVLEFLLWSEMNGNIMQYLSTGDYTTLTDSLRVNAANSLSQVTCNGRSLLASAYLSGAGASSSLLPSVWASGFKPITSKASTIVLSYNTKPETSNLGSVFDATLDFALGYTWQQPNTSLISLPVAAEPLVGVYNVPELAEAATPDALTLSTEVVAGILLNEISMWNDERIVALNPDIAHLLPNESIIVILDMGGSPEQSGGPTGGHDNRPLHQWLSAKIPGFVNATGETTSAGIRYPVQNTPRGIKAGDQLGSPDHVELLASTEYGICWAGLSTVLSRRNLRVANHVYPSAHASSERQTGPVVSADSAYVLAAIDEAFSESNPDPSSTMAPVISNSTASWPIVRWIYFDVLSTTSSTSTSTKCNKMRTITEWLYWTQTDTDTALPLADGEGVLPFASGDSVRTQNLISTLASFTCDDLPVFTLSACVINGTICSNHGSCVTSNQTTVSCSCDDGFEGDRCQFVQSSSSDDTLALALGLGVGLGVCLLLIILVLVGALPVLLVSLLGRRGRRPEWEVRLSDIQNLELIGQGGYGKVYKGTWKGTEVAVKVIDRNRLPDTKRYRQAFAKEIEHMSLLRNPNIVMFMAAATSTVPMCIVMEYMALGSLYDLLHNELIDHMPFQLKSLILLHVARGMNFLHSSNIVHRDLKSLNVLLDSKWNAKVADFGLSTLASAGSGNVRDRNHFEGSVPWAAPEILNEHADIDLFAADVYSFGIITWEVLTREQPYKGKSPAAVAVAVLRDKCRPTLVAQEEYASTYLAKESLELLPHVESVVALIENCWSEEVSVRPTFLEITSNLANLVSRVKAINGGGSSTGGVTGSISSSSDYSAGHYGREGSSRSHSSNESNRSDRFGPTSGGTTMKRVQRFHYYDGPHAIVCSDVAMAGTLWSNVPEAMKDATRIHNELLRSLLPRYGGYETMLSKLEGGAAGTFCMAFANTSDALLWCADVQRALLAADWPESLLRCPPAEELNAGGIDDKLIFRGLRVRMGVHFGTPRCHVDSITRHVEYTGPAVQKTQELASRAAGGVIIMSEDAYDNLKKDRASVGAVLDSGNRIRGLHDTIADEGNDRLYELVLAGLEARCQRTVIKDAVPLHHRKTMTSSQHHVTRKPTVVSPADSDSDDDDARNNTGGLDTSLSFIDPTASATGTLVIDERKRTDHRKEPVELGFLNSANMCRTIINYREILIEKPIGQGSFGIVHKARWKGVPVAVKTLTAKKRLSEEDMLDFRYEIAVLADLSHHNVLAFIGACLGEPHLAIVTEYMGRGSLRDVLHNTSIKLPWALRLRMLRDAADGIRYLHSREQPIIHRDLKSSNLLVDDNYTVKVSDFGLARIKEDNATMTRCGTPAWTAPEVLSSNTYDERADVYSFAIVMWEVLTRRQPYEGRNFIKVTMDVLKGDRPTIPQDCPSDFSKLMRKCWHANPQKRPSMDAVQSGIERMMQSLDDDLDVPSTILSAAV